MVIWYNNNPKRKCWMINNRSQGGTDTAKCVIKSRITITRVEDADRDTLIRDYFSQMIVEGRKGYNRAMNGTYNRLPETRGGKSCYKHESNDFQIRWFETKWVVDWRKGNHDDNLGAAVCKED